MSSDLVKAVQWCKNTWEQAQYAREAAEVDRKTVFYIKCNDVRDEEATAILCPEDGYDQILLLSDKLWYVSIANNSVSVQEVEF